MVRRLVVWFHRKRALSLERQLKVARSRQKAKIEELKNNSAYYQTKGLLERFDKSESSRLTPEPIAFVKPPPMPVGVPPLSVSLGSSSSPSNVTNSSSIKAYVANPTWFDRLMDSLIGDDRMSKYALICPHCHSHNGLARPEDFDYTQYICPNCKKMVPAKRTRPNSPTASVDTITIEAVEANEVNEEEVTLPSMSEDQTEEYSILSEDSNPSVPSLPDISDDSSVPSSTNLTKRKGKKQK